MRLTLTDVALSPNQVTVRAGETVRFSVTNAGRFPHNVTVAHPGRGSEPTLFSINLTGGLSFAALDGLTLVAGALAGGYRLWRRRSCARLSGLRGRDSCLWAPEQ